VKGLTKESFRLFNMESNRRSRILHGRCTDHYRTGVRLQRQHAVTVGSGAYGGFRVLPDCESRGRVFFWWTSRPRRSSLSRPPAMLRRLNSESAGRGRWGGRRSRTQFIWGLNELRKAHCGRKALLIVSDGGDNASRYTRREVTRLLRENEALIYAIGLFAPSGVRVPQEQLDRPLLHRDLAESSGGRVIGVSNNVELPYIAVKVGMEMRNRHVLGLFAAQDGRT
jgi:hypothetical protein